MWVDDRNKLQTYVLINQDHETWNNFLKGMNELVKKGRGGRGPRTYQELLDLYTDIKINGIQTPIDVRKMGEYYYITDGGHRTSSAIALGHSTIDAHVWPSSQGWQPSIYIASPKSVSILPASILHDPDNPRYLQVFKYVDPDILKKIIK
tara:strand:- start:212 stop:661 length:450 start_codon:yes stop_codon:yes gene_type:complete